MLHLLRTRPPRRRLQAVAHPPQGVHVSSRQWDVIADAPRRYRERCHERIANATATTIMGGIAVTTYTARSTQHAACRITTASRSITRRMPAASRRRHGPACGALHVGGVTAPRAARCIAAAFIEACGNAKTESLSRLLLQCPGCDCDQSASRRLHNRELFEIRDLRRNHQSYRMSLAANAVGS